MIGVYFFFVMLKETSILLSMKESKEKKKNLQSVMIVKLPVTPQYNNIIPKMRIAEIVLCLFLLKRSSMHLRNRRQVRLKIIALCDPDSVMY